MSIENDALTAVTFQLDPAHTGGQPLSGLHAPLKRCWSASLDMAALSYPLIAKGRVFLTGSTAGGVRLYALSASDGQTSWGPIDLESGTFRSAVAAFDADKVFAVSNTGSIWVFNAATGAPIWSHSANYSGFVGPPVAVGGKLYVVNNGILSAYDESTGALLWSKGEGGSPTSVAYSPSLLILEYIEGTISGLDPSTGASLWRNLGCCGGGGGDIPVIYRGHVFVPDFWGLNEVLDFNGNPLGSFSGAVVPAFENGLGFFLPGATLEAHDLGGMVKWSFVGDGKLASTPLAASGAVYEGSSTGMLYALDELTGEVTWHQNVGAPIPAANQTYGLVPATGLAASSQLLIVPTTSGIVAYGN